MRCRSGRRRATRRLARRARRARIRRFGRRGLLQLPQDFDLRRFERNPTQHHLANGTGALIMDFIIQRRTAACCATASRNTSARSTASRRASAIIASEAGYSDEVWAQFADMGLLGVAFDEAHGGFGGTAVDTMLVMTELGRGIVVEPYFSTVVLGGGPGQSRRQRGAEAGRCCPRWRRANCCSPPRWANRIRATS